MVKEYTEMTIKPYSTKLLREIMSTITGGLTGGIISMVANIVVPPSTDDVKKIKAYMAECLENKIIPFSRIEWGYNRLGFYVKESAVVKVSPNMPAEIKKTIDERLLEGGKINTMALVLEYPYVIESLRKFEKEFMDVWSGKGYSPESGAFWSIIKKDAPVLLKFSRFDESDPGFILTLSDNRDRFERTNMSNWFNRLKEEYQKSK